MSQILLRVLAVVLSSVSPEPLTEKNVPFDKLPAECAAVYDSDIRQFRQATANGELRLWLMLKPRRFNSAVNRGTP